MLGRSDPTLEANRPMRLAWWGVLALALVDIAWAIAADWSLGGRGKLLSVFLGSACLLPLLFVRRYRSDLRIRSTLLAALLLVAFSFAACILSYLVVSLGTPLFDDTYARWDRAIGFDWLAATQWVDRHGPVKQAFHLAYHSGLVQIGCVVLFLGFSRRLARLNEFIALYLSGVLLAIACSLAFPAAGPWVGAPATVPFDASALSHFFPLRNGDMRAIDFNQAQGLISMPSVHAMIAVFLLWAMRGTGRLFPPVAILNILMLMATPTEGGHYLVDVIGGVVCAVAMVAGYRAFVTGPATADAPAPASGPLGSLESSS